MHWHFYFQFFVFCPLTCKTIMKNYNETVILFNIIIFRKPKSILRLYITTLWKKDWQSKWERGTCRHQLHHIFLNTRTSTCYNTEVDPPVDSLVVSTCYVEVCVVEHGDRCNQPQHILNAVCGLFSSVLSKGLFYLSLCFLINMFT